MTRADRYPLILLGLHTLLFLALAIEPLDRFDWFLENLLVVLVVLPTLILNHRRCALTNLSYTLLFIFLCMHAFGAHYTYSAVPLGFDLQGSLDLTRNHYDRIVHFCFGLLACVPVLEMQSRIAVFKSWWSYMLPVGFTLSLSALYELIEYVVALIVAPDAGNAYLGTQGDQWDAQKDMALAFTGALIAMTYAWIADRSGHPVHRNRCDFDAPAELRAAAKRSP